MELATSIPAILIALIWYVFASPTCMRQHVDMTVTALRDALLLFSSEERGVRTEFKRCYKGRAEQPYAAADCRHPHDHPASDRCRGKMPISPFHQEKSCKQSCTTQEAPDDSRCNFPPLQKAGRVGGTKNFSRLQQNCERHCVPEKL